MNTTHRIIAINLPQFHPFKENDEWWGKGFTEWTNVTKAKPRYPGHYQPHLPSDTGFYDLRLPEARKLQADLAREYGIYGFCYYHYWFNGHQLMERPVNEILSSGEPDFPFMLCWANENWARNWDGGFKDVLIKQNYCDEDDIEHMRWLCKNVFPDKRYIRIDGKPVFAIYKIEQFPDFSHTVHTWRKIAKEEYGMELYLINAECRSSPIGLDALSTGLDASFDFQPVNMSKFIKQVNIFRQLKSFFIHVPLVKKWVMKWPFFFDYAEYVKKMTEIDYPDYKWYPCVSPGFDNAPRRVNKSFMAFRGSTPDLYKKWLLHVLNKFLPYSKEENLVFINAWNEWAEGNHLEPDQKWGRGYLEATKQAIKEANK
ncbi:glycoside hydrolase family 99-like domain-containing protein [Prevotella sp. E9-3]|uniref:glycosyltransferase WbsX family protein n=1 Tax=Prevotella sp. E9-3 TaxID=2913621 RepID=UPI001EDB95B4|nr:glycoside hydrolase family 99-like domain-containing protein [Prevotella sp. E9-3]UKK47603.1 glycoside hydrolase family 99-like domain-containing protein [Prevotella sp. E9-3]